MKLFLQFTKQALEMNAFPSLVRRNLTGLLKALTSDPSNAFGMNWDIHCQPSLVRSTTSAVTLTNALVSEWEQIPAASFQ